jgi:hypothetical protein
MKNSLTPNKRNNKAFVLIQTFTNEFFRKTGMKIKVHVEGDLEELKLENTVVILPDLSSLEECFVKSLPHLFKEGSPNPLHVKSRIREYSDVRCIFSHIARNLGFRLTDIAYYMGKKDHSTIIHLSKKAEELLETDEIFIHHYTKIINQVNTDYATNV